VTFDDRPAADQILLACAAQGPDPAAVEALLDAPIVWTRLVDRAVRHRLAPLLYATLRATPAVTSGRPPDAILSHLRELYEWHAARHVGRVAKLTEIGTVLGREGIPILMLKGAALGNTVYRDPVWRTMGDVDLLIRERDLRTANRVLQGIGYTPDVSWRSDAWYEAHHHHLAPLHSPDGSLIVELHRTIVDPRAARVPIEDLWARAGVARIGGIAVGVLAPSDLILHLCLHLGHDNMFANGRLRDLRDLAETIRRYGAAVEWDAVVERTRAWRVSRYVYWSLWLAREMVGAAVPPEMLERLAGMGQSRSADRVLLRLLPEIMLRPDRWPFALPEWLMAGALPVLVGADGSERRFWALVRRVHRGIRLCWEEKDRSSKLFLRALPVLRRARAVIRRVSGIQARRTGLLGQDDTHEAARDSSANDGAGTVSTR
jgi:hypothetical protein